MAFETLPTLSQVGTTGPVDLTAAVAAGKVEWTSLRITLESGSAEQYGTVYLHDAVNGARKIVSQEPVKYRTAGGSPDLLIGYRMQAGEKLQIEASAGATVRFTAYNRSRDDA